ncbi:hypothetical protein NQ315_009956 [Exocentrus adspersus]|uniref:DNA repair protein RAD51 homolog 3 n=1 Tax=Exocentrus adspersus TaxID=1586481 RepID=A0AAV8WHS5_9CUCU|nr:hypothetical protein NQ315_009956 [Exocentrus adspersus]
MELSVDCLNIPSRIIAQLKDMGNCYLCDIDEDVKENLGLQNATLQKVPETKTALDVCHEELLNGCILTYNENLDSVLKDVIVPKSITELAGAPGSGKTQTCFQLCISVQLPVWCGGMEGEALYVDTNSNFASHRILDIAKDFINIYHSLRPLEYVTCTKFDETSIMHHIHYTKVYDALELMACVKYLDKFLIGRKVRLIVIDSWSFIMRMVDVTNRKMLVSKILCNLRALGSIHNFAVVLTNDLTTRVNKGEAYTTPSFGDSFYHLMNTRVLFSKKDDHFEANLKKNIMHGQKRKTFYL